MEKERVGQGIQGKMEKKKPRRNGSYVYEKMITWAYMQQFFFFFKKFIKIYLRSKCGQSRDKAGINVSGIRMRKFEEGPATSIVFYHCGLTESPI